MNPPVVPRGGCPGPCSAQQLRQREPCPKGPLAPCQECGSSPRSRLEVRTGAVFEPDQVSSVFTCGASLAPHAELKRDQGDRCCILGTLRVSLPPGAFLQGWGRAGSRINPAPPVGTAGLCLSVVPSACGNLLLPLPPHLGAACSWQPFPAPHPSSSGASGLCWERLLGMGLIPGVSFPSRVDGQSCWACQLQSLIAKVTAGKNDKEVCQSGAVRPHLPVCALGWRLLCIGPAGNECPLPNSA